MQRIQHTNSETKQRQDNHEHTLQQMRPKRASANPQPTHITRRHLLQPSRHHPTTQPTGATPNLPTKMPRLRKGSTHRRRPTELQNTVQIQIRKNQPLQQLRTQTRTQKTTPQNMNHQTRAILLTLLTALTANLIGITLAHTHNRRKTRKKHGAETQTLIQYLLLMCVRVAVGGREAA